MCLVYIDYYIKISTCSQSETCTNKMILKARHERAHERRKEALEAEKKEKGAKDKFKNKRGLAKVAARNAWYANRNLVEVDDMSKEAGDAMDREVLNDFDSDDCDADDEYVPEPEDRRLIRGERMIC